MAQNITIKVAGKELPLTIDGEENERSLRLAAEELGKMLAKYDATMPDRPLEDRICLVALAMAKNRLQLSSRLEMLTAELEALKSDVSTYLKSVQK